MTTLRSHSNSETVILAGLFCSRYVSIVIMLLRINSWELNNNGVFWKKYVHVYVIVG